MDLMEIVQQVAKQLNLPEEAVKESYFLMWKFIRTTINNLSLKQELTEQEFNALKHNFNLPSLGKLGVTYKKYLAIRRQVDYSNKLRQNENKEN